MSAFQTLHRTSRPAPNRLAIFIEFMRAVDGLERIALPNGDYDEFPSGASLAENSPPRR